MSGSRRSGRTTWRPSSTGSTDGDIDGYMAKQQHKPDASKLWVYFQNVIALGEGHLPEVTARR